MKSPDDAWQDWLAHRRDGPPPVLADRVLAALPAAEKITAVGQPLPRVRSGIAPRMASCVLWCAAAMVCAARVYSVVSLVVSPVVMQSDEAKSQEPADEQLVVSRT